MSQETRSLFPEHEIQLELVVSDDLPLVVAVSSNLCVLGELVERGSSFADDTSRIRLPGDSPTRHVALW